MHIGTAPVTSAFTMMERGHNMATGILINLNRCVGCWTCAMSCKVGNDLADDDFRITVETHGSGAGIDRPSGVYPKLQMHWQPHYAKSCIYCAPRVKDGYQPYCTDCCPTEALTFGDYDDGESPLAKELERLRDGGYNIFHPSAWENSKQGITYARKS